MHTRIRAAWAVEELGRAIRDHFVGVHVVRRAGACLVHVDDELIAKIAVDDLVGGRDDSGADGARQPVERHVGPRRALLDEDGRRDELGVRPQSADRKVLERAYGLDAVVGVFGDGLIAQRVSLDTVGHGGRRRVSAPTQNYTAHMLPALFDSVLDLIVKTSTDLPPDVRVAMRQAGSTETPGTQSAQALTIIAQNIDLAANGEGAICQDTGMPTFEIKTPVGVNQIAMTKAIRDAVAEATRRGKLRPNSVDSITGENSGDN